MFIKLTLMDTNGYSWFKADGIRNTEPIPGNALGCQIITNVITNKGFVSFNVLDNPEDVVHAACKAIETGMPQELPKPPDRPSAKVSKLVTN